MTEKKDGMINKKKKKKIIFYAFKPSHLPQHCFIKKIFGHIFQNKELLCINENFNFYRDQKLFLLVGHGLAEKNYVQLATESPWTAESCVNGNS